MRGGNRNKTFGLGRKICRERERMEIGIFTWCFHFTTVDGESILKNLPTNRNEILQICEVEFVLDLIGKGFLGDLINVNILIGMFDFLNSRMRCSIREKDA